MKNKRGCRMSDNLADKVIGQIEQDKAREIPAQYPNQWGVDDTGFPWPNPVNAQAVAIRIFFKWGRVDGVDKIFKIGDDVFLGGKRLHQDRSTLLSLYSKPKIVAWANQSPDRQSEEEIWRQIKKTISSEWPVVWTIIKEVAPEYSRDYIRVTNDIVWGKDESDLIIM